MSAIKFAEEFTQLLLRWTSASSSNDKDKENGIVPLTNQQILNAIQNVLRIILGVNLADNDYSSVSTPASGIVVCTPTAPTVPKNNANLSSGNLNRFKSLDTLTASMSQSENFNFGGTDSLASKSQEKMEVADNDTLEALPDEKKFISRSNPSIHVSNFGRSDTFIREKSPKDAAENDKSTEENMEDISKEFEFSSDIEKKMSQALLQKLEALRKCAFDVVSKIDDVKKEAYPQTTKPIRRLSSIGGFPGLTRSSTMMRPAVPPKLRRSSTAFPGTPTSSKLNTTITADKEAASSRRKSISAASIHRTSKISTPSPATRPTVNLTLPINKKSPTSGAKLAKNPKYAHVQSTIPKVSVGKRKAP